MFYVLLQEINIRTQLSSRPRPSHFMISTKHDNEIFIIHSFAFGGRGYFICSFGKTKCFSSTHPKFDQTRGYPGEGPTITPCPDCISESGKKLGHRGPHMKLTSEERRKRKAQVNDNIIYYLHRLHTLFLLFVFV